MSDIVERLEAIAGVVGDVAAKAREELVRINAEKQAREQDLAGRLLDASGRNDELTKVNNELAAELARVQDTLAIDPNGDAKNVIRIQEDDLDAAAANLKRARDEIVRLRAERDRLREALRAARAAYVQHDDGDAVTLMADILDAALKGDTP
jgi:hypothetical protein